MVLQNTKWYKKGWKDNQVNQINLEIKHNYYQDVRSNKQKMI